jgi:hypothetical protein
MWGAGAAFYGQSPSDWLVASYSSRDSSGASNRIYLKRIEKIGTDEKYDLGTSENSIRGSKPLIAMETKSKDSIIVLSSGNRGAQIEELSLLTGNIRKIGLLSQMIWVTLCLKSILTENQQSKLLGFLLVKEMSFQLC